MVYIPQNQPKTSAKRSKYRNKKVAAQGKNFDSIKERDRFFFLQSEQRRGAIRNLRCQVSFDLDVNGQHICRYVADFVYERNPLQLAPGAINYIDQKNPQRWFVIVEDVKARATKTDVYKLKKKLMMAVHGIEISEVFHPTCAI